MMLQEAAVLGLISFAMSFVVLAFFGSVLLNIVDAVFFCYAVDKDMQAVTRADVHEVFSQVGCGCTPCCKLVFSLHHVWLARHYLYFAACTLSKGL
jgi:hypothetical protein